MYNTETRRLRRSSGLRPFEILEPRQLLAASPLITEFMASNNNALEDGDGNSADWIEVYNAGDEAIDLVGYRLTDTPSNPARWTFPNRVLAPGEYLVVFASGQDINNYVDSANNLHTNFKLGAGGEYLALVAPDGSIVSQFGTDKQEYPAQVTDVSFGFNQANKLINSQSQAHYWLPDSDRLGTSWTATAFDPTAEGFVEGTASLGFESRPDDRTNFTREITTSVRDGAHAVYVRIPFEVDGASAIKALKLRTKFDNGVVVYLNGQIVLEENAPENLGWFSTAPNNSPRDSNALEFVEFDLSSHTDKLVNGDNVLAVHLLNNFADNSDLLLVTELIADSPLSESPLGYLPEPTPGGPNFSLSAVTGPLIRDVTSDVAALADDQDLVVTARVEPLNGPVNSVSLHYRVNYDNEIAIGMADDGTGGDSTANDGVLTAVIPAPASSLGDMLRWRVTASDESGNQSRGPHFLDQTGNRQSAEYHGTVIADPSIDTTLPVFQWFTDNVSGSRSRRGARASAFHMGEFYDNIYVRQRGGATNASSQKFVFNRQHEFLVNEELGRVREFNMNAQGSDPSYVRQTLAYQAYQFAGNPASESFLMYMTRNGSFDRVGVFIEQVDEDFLDRNGFDPNGALYKFVQRGNLGPVFSDTVTGIEKKTRLDENLDDLRALVAGLNQDTLEERRVFVFDNFNLPELMNYLAVRSITLEADDVRKNFYMYRDTNGNGQWSIFPWDKDWTFGVEGDGGTHLRSPFFGDEAHAKQNANQWNVLYNVIFGDPITRQMFLRRLRTVMDEFLKPPGTPADQLFFEPRLQALFEPVESLLPRNAASAVDTMLREGRRGYFDRRREDLFVNHSIDNPDFRDNAGIPHAQAGNPLLSFGQIESNPDSGIQDEEYIELVNPNDTAVDISGWQLTGGIEFTFQPGSVIPAGRSLYVTPSVNAFRARATGPRGGQSLFVQGNYDGHLSSDGETVALVARDGSILARVSVGGQPSDIEQFLRVTELNYHPHASNAIPGLNEPDDQSPSAADRFEYIELLNTGGQQLDLSGVTFSAGVDFTFDAGTTLSPGQYTVVVKDRIAFQSRYGQGINIAGEFAGSLDDTGDNLFLDSQSGRAIASVSYRPDGDWPLRAAGRGSSLELVDPDARVDLPANWRASVDFGGSPGTAGAVANSTVSITEVLTNSVPPGNDMIEFYNAAGDVVSIGNWYLSNSDRAYFQFAIPSETQIPERGYVTLSQTQFGFDLDAARGDQLWLISADSTGKALQFIDHVQFGPSAAGTTLGPWPTGDDSWLRLAEPTFGQANAGPGVGEVAITEIYFAPLDPDGRGRQKPDDFEFVELYNRTDATINMSGWTLDGDVHYSFPEVTEIGPRQTLLVLGFDPADVVPANIFRFTLGAPTSTTLIGPFSQPLDDSSGTIRLIRPDLPPADNASLIPMLVLDQVSYATESPWPSDTLATGNSLTRVNPTSYGPQSSSWLSRPASPGEVDFIMRIPGDSNEDGVFDRLDLVFVLQAGKYLTGETATFAQGDWNGDGLFNQLDLVEALR